jgi:elongation factor P hydroxylase
LPVRTPAILLVFSFLAATILASVPTTTHAAAAQKVVIIVGPVGSTTDNYRAKADHIAETAEVAGATVVKVYSPNATWANVRTAVAGANVIVYLGHGNGYPNPYSATENPDRVNGWGLNMVAGKAANDPTGDGDAIGTSLAYCGEKALLGTLTANDGATQWNYCGGTTNTDGIAPAANFVMIYSNACYAPGAGESRPAPPESMAVSRVANYASPILRLGGTYFATDIGSDRLVDLVLRNRGTAWGRIFEMGNGFSADALRRFEHPDVAGAEVWVQRTNTGLGDDYWYAFAGNPAETPSGTFVAYTPPQPMGITFSDIAGNPFEANILWLANSGITGGCGNGRFCPDQRVTREQMASFLARALHLPAATSDHFVDDESSIHEENINRLAESGVTGGCSTDRFCPGGYVTRAEMASFLARARGLPASATDFFSDDNSSIHEPNINRVAADGIANGCGEGRYCPEAIVTRGQMAAFLNRAFGD